KAKEITRRDVVGLLAGMMARGATVTTNRTLAVVRRMFNYAVEQSILEFSPCDHVRAPAKEQRRDRVLTVEELRAFWWGLDRARMSEPVKVALRLLLVTAQRKGEVAAATWQEFGMEQGWWVIPADRAKNGMSHRVPLSRGALRLLEVARVHSDQSSYLFPSPRAEAPMGPTAIDHAVRRNLSDLGLQDFTPHDLRRTAASMMTGQGIPRLVVSKILNHVESGITAVYDRYCYDDEKRQALERWWGHLEGILERKNG
ncbi:MAG: site-specific integrase, partial [Magnetococcus sp. MYC-9]